MKRNRLSAFTLGTILVFSAAPVLSRAEDSVGDNCNNCTKPGEITKLVQKTSGALIKLDSSASSIDQKDGVIFSCSKDQIIKLREGMAQYFSELGVDPKLVNIKSSADGTKLGFNLNTPADDTNTLNLGTRKELNITDEIVELPMNDGKTRKIPTVSKKEIAFALFQHGRKTEFKNNGCNIEAFKDHVGIRQNTAAWTEDLNWYFPDDGTDWNPKYWSKNSSMPKKGPLHEAIHDIFLNQDKYAMGCYSASKIVMSHGILDYYSRVKPDPVKLAKIEKIMLADKAPLSDVEPGTAWDFVKSMSKEDLKVKGKILDVQKGVAPNNFIPGDWSYIKNTDGPSSDIQGYEGSNAIYLGRNHFDDFYYDKRKAHLSYTFEGKIGEVYQWRNGAFEGDPDTHKNRKTLTPEEFQKLLQTPENGGILIDHRIEPKIF